MRRAAQSVGCVYVVLCAYTASPLLALFGLVQIVLAFPVTLYVYAVVLQIKLFGVLQAMAIFVILGRADPEPTHSATCCTSCTYYFPILPGLARTTFSSSLGLCSLRKIRAARLLNASALLSARPL